MSESSPNPFGSGVKTERDASCEAKPTPHLIATATIPGSKLRFRFRQRQANPVKITIRQTRR